MGLSKRSRKFLRITFSVMVIGVILFFTGRYILYTQIRKAITQELEGLRDEGINVAYDFMDVHPFSGKIEFYQFRANVTKDSSKGFSCLIPHLLIKGIDVIPFITEKTLAIQSIALDQASITYSQGAELIQKDAAAGDAKIVLQNVRVKNISLPEFRFILKDSLAIDTVARMRGDFTIHNLDISTTGDSLTWKDAELQFNNIALALPKELYGISIRSFRFVLADKTLRLDSIKVQPLETRQAFMKTFGKEIDYISGFVPFINIENINWQTLPTKELTLGKINLEMKMEVFRDKRYPFIKYKTTVLPSHFLHQIPIRLSIDTIQLTNSYVSYEEYPEQGDSSGLVFFDKLNATIAGVHNNPELQQPITMKAYSKFMGTGDLLVDFIFPHRIDLPYQLKGTLKNLELSSLNRMLGAAVKIKIESGIMTNLKFNYSYTMLKSDGEVELNYNGLKLQFLRENRNEEQAVSPFKTLLLNTFIKKDMDKTVDKDKRTGTVEFYRDTKRSIFNYWWKSVLAGLKSAYGLDKLQGNANGTARKIEKRKKKEARSAKV